MEVENALKEAETKYYIKKKCIDIINILRKVLIL